MNLPHDHPLPGRPHRVYAALTNACNRDCPWCSTCSSPAGSTWLSLEAFKAAWPAEGPFEVQLEGGEPTIHPDFWDFVAAARAEPRCRRLVLCTNGVKLPREGRALESWLYRLGAPLTVKLSVNHHLLGRDAHLISLAQAAREALSRLGGDRSLVVNVRLRRGVAEDDRRVREAVEKAGLLGVSNVFFLQRYGFASEEAGWDLPFLAGTGFRMQNPDGRLFGPDLVGRSEAMRLLP